MKNELRLFCRLIQTGGFALFLKNRPRRYDKSAALVPRGKSAGPGASGWKLFRFPPPLTQLKFNFSLLFLQSFLLKKKRKNQKAKQNKKKKKNKKTKNREQIGARRKRGSVAGVLQACLDPTPVFYCFVVSVRSLFIGLVVGKGTEKIYCFGKWRKSGKISISLS